MKEIWKKVRPKKYRKFYRVSSIGRIKSVDGRPMIYKDGRRGTSKGKVLKPWLVKRTGYYSVGLSWKGEVKHFPIHRLVAEAFICNPENKREVNHKNGVKTNNRASNLEWNTPKENGDHASRHNLIQKGVQKCNSKLTDAGVREIRQMFKKKYRHSKIAKIFGVAQAVIRQIAIGRTWKHVE